MLSQYADFSQTMAVYCFLPYVTAYVTLATSSLFSDRVGKVTSPSSLLSPQYQNSLGLVILIYLSFLLPIFLIFYTYRGVEGSTATLTGALLACNLKWVLLLLSFFFLSLISLLLRYSSHMHSKYTIEVYYAYIFLFLAWFFVSFSVNVLTFLLALEVVTLLLILLMCNLWLFGASACSGLRTNGHQAGLVAGQAQYALISVVLSFVWVMGFATIFFLWAVALSFPTFNSTDFFYVSLVGLNWKSQVSGGLFSSFMLSGSWLAFALLFKLVLQPFQTFLTLFYKQLPPTVLLGYFQFYYILVLFFLFFFIVTPFGFMTFSWH